MFMADGKVIFLSLFMILILITAGCVTPPGSDKKATVTPTKASTTKVTTIPTASPTPAPPQLPMFTVGQIALTSKGGSSGLAIANSISAINMYGTIEVKREKIGNVVVWYTDGEQIITWKQYSAVDNKYKFVEYGIDPTRIPFYKTGKELSVVQSGACYPLGDWNVNDGSVYKLRADGFAVKQVANATQVGNDIRIGHWRSLRTSEGRSYRIDWDYGPGGDYPLFIDKIEVSEDLTKFNGVDNYGRTFSGKWAYSMGAIGSEKRCSDWPGGNDWYKNVN